MSLLSVSAVFAAGSCGHHLLRVLLQPMVLSLQPLQRLLLRLHLLRLPLLRLP